MQANRFENKVVLVTGAASGIGHACAERLIGEGAIVLMSDRDARGCDIATRLGAEGFLALDVAAGAAWTMAASEIDRRFGRLDVFISSAGLTQSGMAASVAQADMEQLRRLSAVNVEGAWLGIQALLPLLTRPRGSIVTIGSRAGQHAAPYAAAYAASKAALESLTRSTALYCARANLAVRCNIVLPGSVDTPMWRPISGDGRVLDRDSAIASGLPHIPAGRLARAEEVAAAVLFLASDDASYINGTSLLVDGGQSCL